MTKTLREQVELAIIQQCLPAMAADGGGLQIAQLDEEGQTLELELIGPCRYCPSRCQSAAAIHRRLKKALPEMTIIITTE